MKNLKILIILLLLIVGNFIIFNYVAARGDDNAPVKLDDPLGGRYNDPNGGPNINLIIGQVISAVLGIVGSLALAMFIYGGFVWMTAAGNKASVDKGKDIITWAALGLIVIFSAYALVNFILKNVIGGAAG